MAIDYLYESLGSLEQRFSYSVYLQYHRKYWTIVYPVILLYLLFIYFAREWMKSRPKFTLRRTLITWNSILALFSLWGAARSLPELYSTLCEKGIHGAICHPPVMHPSYGLAVAAFILSKFVELGDTVFIILRKQKLIFLHWYHHVTVLFCVCFTVNYDLSTVRWYVTTNYTVHSVMYSYYALKAMNVHVPRIISILITTGQLAQMVIAFAITAYAANERFFARECTVDPVNIGLGLICYGSYFLLFGHFFYLAYVKKEGKRKFKSDSVTATETTTKCNFLDTNENKIKSL